MAIALSNRSSKAYAFIRNQLVTGRLQAGSRVSDSEVATEMGISRTPVREALIRLENEGIVQQVPRVGIFVRVPTARELIELYEMRRLLESYAAAKAARRMNAEQLAELKRLCGLLREEALEWRRSRGKALAAEIVERTTLADAQFHLLIMKAAGNRRLMRIVSSMHLMSQLVGHNWSNPQKLTPLHRSAHTLLDHHRIMRAIERRDAKAASYWMRHHLRPRRDVAADLRRLHANLKDARSGFTDLPQSTRDSLRKMEDSAESV
ncbi:MAG: GntR family transcriptional regulator [Phycisphaerales bacterium]|jgi:DNA-binding GntR family transcriptional regulator|nr:GntR family transcriptional regulator [Phycisphaerales bacterium]